MKTKRAQTFTMAFLAGSLAFSGVAGAFDAATTHPRTTRESVSSAGTPALGTVLAGSLSADGRYVVFMSTASNLLAGVSGTHVYRHDRTTGVTALVDVAKTGSPSIGAALAPSVSAGGRFVAFASSGTDLVNGDTNGQIDVFLRDMNDGTTAMVSATQTGAPADKGGTLTNVAGARYVSDDGRYVAFTSLANNLVATSNNNKQQVYVKDMLTGLVTLASADATAAAGNDASSAPSLSGNGHVVAFVSLAANFSPLATSHTSQVFVRDLELGNTTLESVTSAGAIVAGRPSTSPALSFDGHYVAFESQAALDARDRDGLTGWDVYLRDRTLGTTAFASYTNNTFVADSRAPSISADGRWVGFNSMDPLFVSGDVNGTFDVFLYDRLTATVSLASQNDAGQQVNAAATGPSVSSDGRLVLFNSTASNLVTTPTSTGAQLYAHDMKTNEAPVVTLGADQSLDEGVRLSRMVSFSDQDASTSWTAAVNYGDGSGSAALALAANKTFTLDHLFKPGSYVVSVAVTDNAAATGTGSFRVTVTNLAPTVNLGGAVDLTFDPTLHQSGTFSDPGTTETYYATVNYGDGSGGMALVLTGNSFLLDHTYATAGTYTVAVAVTDSEGASGSATLAVTVRKYSFQWHEPVESSFSVGRLLPVKFSVTRPDGTPVFDSTVRVDVLNSSGAVVAGYIYGTSPSGAVTWNGNDYHVNVDTRGFAPGDYTLRVSFSSPTMTGSFTKQTTVIGDGTVTSTSTGNDKKDKSDKAADKAAKK